MDVEDRLRLLHVIPRLSRGGAAKLVHDLAIELRERDVQVDVCLFDQAVDVHSPALRRHGIRVHNVNLKSIYSISSYVKLVRLSRGYNLIHVHLFPTLYIASVILRLFHKNASLIFTEHSTFNRRRRYPFLRHIEKRLYFTYSAVIAISEPVKRSLCNWLPELANKIVIIDNAIKVERYSCAEPAADYLVGRYDADNESIFLLMVSAFEPRKDHETLLQALAKLPSNYRLLLVGEGSLRQHYERRVAELGLESRVRFLGYRSDVPAIMKSCDLYVQSSNWEGFGLAAVEAMAAGLPVVASNVEGLRDVVGEAGTLFERGDAHKLAEAIELTHANRKFYIAAGKRQSEMYDISVFADKHLDLYRRLAGDVTND